MPSDLRFDPDTHHYTLDGRVVESVTQRIQQAGLLGSASTWYTPEAAERGTAVHLACEHWDIGARVDICAEWNGYIQSYQSWSRAMSPMWTSVEQPYYSAELDLAGTPDRIGLIAGQDVVLDIKSGPPHQAHGVQLALYDLLRPLQRRRRRLGLYLRVGGQLARMVPYLLSTDYVIALALCNQQNKETHDQTDRTSEDRDRGPRPRARAHRPDGRARPARRPHHRKK